MNCVQITKTDDVVPQRHKKIGTEKLYTYFDSKDVSINVQIHDRNMTIKVCEISRAYSESKWLMEWCQDSQEGNEKQFLLVPNIRRERLGPSN